MPKPDTRHGATLQAQKGDRPVVGLARWRLAEHGYVSLTMFILTVPLMLLAFGYGFESLRLVYLRNFLESRATMAASAGVAVNYASRNTEGQSKIFIGQPEDTKSGEKALAAAYANYRLNTDSKRTSAILTCGAPGGERFTVEQLHPDETGAANPTSSAAVGGSGERRLQNKLNQKKTEGVDCYFVSRIIGKPLDPDELCSSVATSSGVTLTRPEYGVVVGVNEQVAMTFFKIFNIDERPLDGIQGSALIRASDAC